MRWLGPLIIYYVVVWSLTSRHIEFLPLFIIIRLILYLFFPWYIICCHTNEMNSCNLSVKQAHALTETCGAFSHITAKNMTTNVLIRTKT